MIENTNDYFVTFDDLLYDAEQERLSITPEKMGTFWIKVLDQYTCWIFPHDLVVIWADSWVGKSELAYNITVANAKKWKKVCLFALEWNLSEMAWRFTQREMASCWERVKTPEYRINTKPEHHEFAKAIYWEVWEQWRWENIGIFNKKAEPTIEFIEEVMRVSSEYYDMFVIDHLHYLQFTNDRENEQISKVMRTLQKLTWELKKPVVLIGHVRKRAMDKDPTMYDLHWSSNIPKEATTVIMISKMDINENEKRVDWIQIGNQRDTNHLSWTKFIIDKSRAWMPTPTKLSLIYDLVEKRYLEEYSCLIKQESVATENDIIL